ncbi:Similar to tr/Q8YMG4/Q8YMG4 [Microcystis aeruginosa PCC 9806]|uniref:Hydantoinase/oxoprolinase family protein n=2 Tax=Microcystis TaxID=1125 RepID=A0A552L9U7_9CHRO|nr:hydantoinase/oxoprolinase family protein [Microcystis aeruginosa]TRV16987.1 MAG: hydantoinase/oxoprolinase family protein [Microcystis flos-aquae Mf_WU_F_19750830_S460]CCI13838.1 Similar to tr/Q8YMG4/Q8YMG4 [Microcystis aeruginosa PCC 9806]
MLKFLIDRGGTFTDIVAIIDQPEIIERLARDAARFLIVPLADQQWIVLYKLLSENPEKYPDAVIQGIKDISGSLDNIEVIKMGTTVATNALLERKGERTVLLITKGFKDALRIGYQNRPDIFARQIILPSLLYEQVIEVAERYDSQGQELITVNPDQVKADLIPVYQAGIRSCAIVFMHGYRYPDHEKQVAAIAEEIGFTHLAISHQVSPLMKLVSRGDTTVVSAYLSPILRRYVDSISQQLPKTSLLFMKSDGGLVTADKFQGKDSILSGPAGGIVGAVQTSLRAGFSKIISFDMGGTSTDVSHFQGEYERQTDNEIAGVRMRAPMLSIHTVAAGGGSILVYDGYRFRVGPESAGANPGPACYRRGGPLTITDANVLLGKIQAAYFPAIFGQEGNLHLDREIVLTKFQELAGTMGGNNSTEMLAAGFIQIAVENMANAIKKISLQKGYDLSDYTLCTFGGAGGQVACLIADTLGMKSIFLHPYAGVLSAYGMGLADLRVIKEKAIEQPLNADLIGQLLTEMKELEVLAGRELEGYNRVRQQVSLKYQGSDATLVVNFSDQMRQDFEWEHQRRYGFKQEQKALIVESIAVELIQTMDSPQEAILTRTRPMGELPPMLDRVAVFMANQWRETPIYQRSDLQPFDYLAGPAIIIEKISTIVIEPGWMAKLTEKNHLILSKD